MDEEEMRRERDKLDELVGAIRAPEIKNLATSMDHNGFHVSCDIVLSGKDWGCSACVEASGPTAIETTRSFRIAIDSFARRLYKTWKVLV